MIYLDNAATTRVLDEVVELTNVYYKEKYFNPSALYEGALSINKDILQARKAVADCLGCDKSEVIFTSGGSESNNTAIFGAIKNKKGRIITTSGEHTAVYAPVKELKNKGYDVQFTKILKDGSIDFEHFKSTMNNETIFVSVIHAGNETGAINDIKKIAGYAKSVSPDCIVHSDGTQAFLKTDVNVKQLNTDLYSISGHKVHCPKGIGALYIKKGVTINPLIYGAAQEYGLRAGTENTAQICGLGRVCGILSKTLHQRKQHYKEMKNIFTDIIKKQTSNFIINSADNGLDNILSVSFAGIKSDVLIQMMSDKGIYLGSGSACSSRQKTSRVLKEAGVPEKFIEGSIRISFSHFNTLQEIEFAAQSLAENIKSLRNVVGWR